MRFTRLLLIFFFPILPLSSLQSQAPIDYKKIDRHARRAPESLHQHLPDLTSYLLSKARNDQEKVRAIYTWIATNIRYDEKAYRDGIKRINRNNQDILQRKTAVCFGYASLFSAMCELAGLPGEVISGYSKGTLTSRPDLTKVDHAWNAVQIDGEWYLLDVTWGSSVAHTNHLFVPENAEQYFLTPPGDFLLNHLPALPMWQLLDCPVPPSVFQGSPETIRQFINQNGSYINFRDSIHHWRALPADQQALLTAENAYRFHPVQANRNELGHSYMDYAGRLSERAEAIQHTGSNEQLILVQDSIITICSKAIQFADSLYNWQKELYVNVLINQSVALYQRLAEKPGQRQEVLLEMRGYLEKAQEIIQQLPSGAIYAQQAGQRCDEYLEVVLSEIQKE